MLLPGSPSGHRGDDDSYSRKMMIPSISLYLTWRFVMKWILVAALLMFLSGCQAVAVYTYHSPYGDVAVHIRK
jgi:hypothetical protein